MPRRVLEGSVVSAKNDKTITVLVERRFMHPMYKKYIKSTSKYRAHDENNSAKEGDRVSIIECRPLSKSKRWTIVSGDETAPATKKAEKKTRASKPVAKKAEEKKPVAPKKEKKAGAKKESAKKAPAKKPAVEKKAATKKDAK